MSKSTDTLIRIARIEGKYVVDEKGNANGRGCRICPNCVEKAIKTRALNKSFKANVPNEIYETLRAAMLARENNNVTLAKYAPKEYIGK